LRAGPQVSEPTTALLRQQILFLGLVSGTHRVARTAREVTGDAPMRPKPLMATFTLASVVVLTAAA